MSNLEWDSTTVIGSKNTRAKVARDESDVNAARRAGAQIDTDKKTAGGTNKGHTGPDHARIAKLDRENEVAPPAPVSADVGKAMQKARLELSMTQKDLAQKVNEKPSVIGDYEAGRAIPNAQVLAKIERNLKVKLRGKDIGMPFGSPGTKK